MVSLRDAQKFLEHTAKTFGAVGTRLEETRGWANKLAEMLHSNVTESRAATQHLGAQLVIVHQNTVALREASEGHASWGKKVVEEILRLQAELGRLRGYMRGFGENVDAQLRKLAESCDAKPQNSTRQETSTVPPPVTQTG